MTPNKNLHVVLVRAENPLNIGQAARAMRNFGVSHLSLVNCAPHQTNEAYTVGWRGKNILDKAAVCKSLKSAVRKFDFVVGFTARSGRRRGEPRSLIDAAPQIIEALKDGKVALVFGNEKNGLSNNELRCCHETVIIPADHHYPTLNLSHAVAVALFAIAGKNFDVRSISKKKERFFATLQDFEELIADFRRTLILLDYQKSKRKQLLERTLENISRLLKKAGLDKREFHLFKAFLSRINQKISSGAV